MRVLVTLSVILAAAAPLAGCGHSEVKAPCSASEGYMSLGVEDRCGPMRPIKEPSKSATPERPPGSMTP